MGLTSGLVKRKICCYCRNRIDCRLFNSALSIQVVIQFVKAL